MERYDSTQITDLIAVSIAGDRDAEQRLLVRIHDELKELAERIAAHPVQLVIGKYDFEEVGQQQLLEAHGVQPTLWHYNEACRRIMSVPGNV